MEIDMEKLRNYVDERTNSIRDRQEFSFDFGKYKGYRVLEVFQKDPQYLRYIYEKAKYRLTPKIHEFIIDNSSDIKLAIEKQEKQELNVF